MSATSLHHRIDRLITRIDRQLPRPTIGPLIFDLSLFPEPEQAQLKSYLATLPDPLILSNLTDQQLHIIEYWANLAIALAEDNEQEAARLREMINTPDEKLLQTFLNLDLDVLPACNLCIPDPKEQADHTTYTYTRVNYLHLSSMVERQGVERYRDDLWRWVRFLTGYQKGKAA
jgi:hypothetical protein